MTAPGIQVRGLSLRFGARRIFDNLTFAIPGGQWVSLLGASGAGKTSLLRIIAGLAKATAGDVRASDGQPIDKRLAWMGQKDLLYPWLSVRDNVSLGARLRGERVDHRRVAALLQQVGLEHCAGDRPAALSGGMRQRAALARALLNEPRLLLLDEPLGKLDSLTRISMQRELIALWQQQGYTSLLVTHDIEEALLLCERVLVMSPRPGRIIAEFALPLAFPRHRDNPQLLQHRQDILRILGQEEDW